jgi:hypothetical protein
MACSIGAALCELGLRLSKRSLSIQVPAVDAQSTTCNKHSMPNNRVMVRLAAYAVCLPVPLTEQALSLHTTSE